MPSLKLHRGTSGSLHQKRRVESCRNSSPLQACQGASDVSMAPSSLLGGLVVMKQNCIVGRKTFFAYNVMAVCDASLCFTSLVVNWPGSAHDSRVFNESALCQALQGGRYRGFLLGDSGYPCRTYLLTPYPNPRAPHEIRFNEAHARTRNCVERVFEIVKRRFGVLAVLIRTKLAARSDIIVAAVVLHNIALFNNLPLEEGPDNQVEDNSDVEPEEPDHQNNVAAGQARRAEIAAGFF